VEIALGPGKDDILKGRLLLAQGNKMRLKLDGVKSGQPFKIAMVSDGTKVRVSGGIGDGKDQETPKQLSDMFLASLTRTGLFIALFSPVVVEPGKKPELFDLNKEFAVSDLKLGKKESVSGKETQAVDYKLSKKGQKDRLAVTVWIDVKTTLPVKRVVRPAPDLGRIMLSRC
jgi:hypothetical protein